MDHAALKSWRYRLGYWCGYQAGRFAARRELRRRRRAAAGG